MRTWKILPPVMALVLALAVTALLAPAPARARVVETKVRGTFNAPQENACIHVSTFFYLTDCTYTRAHPEVGGQPLQPHQKALIDAAAALVAKVPAGA